MGIIGLLCLGGLSVVSKPAPAKQAPVGIVVPHHDMVAAARRAYFDEVAAQVQPETIVIVAPDHFDQAVAPIVTSQQDWETVIGTVPADRALIESLNITVQADSFTSEHAITSLLKDIKQSFPSSKIVPILINRAATYEEVTALTKQLYVTCPECLLIASVDFSHTIDVMVADLHDVAALRGLFAADAPQLYREAEVDSPESLVALVTWSALHGAEQFDLFSHTNSGFLSGTVSGEMTTHIIGGYHIGSAAPQAGSITFMMAGDAMFARGVHERFQRDATVFESLGQRFFWGADVALVNLEGYFTDTVDKELWQADPPQFGFHTAYVDVLRYLRVNVVNVANNHAGDGGASAFGDSLRTVAGAGISYIGDDTDSTKASVYTKEINGVKLAIIGVYTHQGFTGLRETIEQYSRAGYHVFVYAHWGEEYAAKSNEIQQQMAHDWIDRGADLVVGIHPHVVQEVEVYAGRPIVYSLGNFIFDQGFSDETKVGAVVGGAVKSGELSVFLVPVQSYLSPAVLEPTLYKKYRDTWAAPWQVYQSENGYYTFDLE
ncbi:MAG: AmmeMemoRadiSam system protein B [Candidatus Kaiserbacteria bacterium]|nr:AmmeMemoRadiSam system protein B [Candidatus Kaiserbacteria bacterium]